MDKEYQEKLAKELDNFRENTEVHDLPKIFHYWSHKFLRPMIEEFGYSGIEDFFTTNIIRSIVSCNRAHSFICSIGSGNCDLEISLAKILLSKGFTNFNIECLEINETMLRRGQEAAVASGVERFLSFKLTDFNNWASSKVYVSIIANHSLHHVVNLEGLFHAIKGSLHHSGRFIVSDIIGRNGHMRWPEALFFVENFWSKLEDSKKYNHIFRRVDVQYINWDCSIESFEGIRAQDILKLIIDRFDFEEFIGFANVIVPFIDRMYGHNFDPTNSDDCSLIDLIHICDEENFQRGILKPTQMLAVMTPGKTNLRKYSRGISPFDSLRNAECP